jgi:hypothetical protein
VYEALKLLVYDANKNQYTRQKKNKASICLQSCPLAMRGVQEEMQPQEGGRGGMRRRRRRREGGGGGVTFWGGGEI